MPSSNIKIFDQNKENMMSDANYANHTQRLNGVQTGVADSQLQNKFQYQMSLFAYALAQMMNANGIDANDTDSVVTFVANLSNTILQKVADKGTADDIAVGGNNSKWVSPAAVSTFLKSIFNFTGPVKSNGNLDFSEAYATDLKFSSLDSTTIQQYLQNLKLVLPSFITGSYVGTGTYGENNKNSIHFDRTPKMVIVYRYVSDPINSNYGGLNPGYDYPSWCNSFIWVPNTERLAIWGLNDLGQGSSAWVHFDPLVNNTLSWYASDTTGSGSYTSQVQLNESGATYYYFALVEGNEIDVPDIVDITVPGLDLTEEQKEAARDNIDAAQKLTYTDVGDGNIVISWG